MIVHVVNPVISGILLSICFVILNYGMFHSKKLLYSIGLGVIFMGYIVLCLRFILPTTVPMPLTLTVPYSSLITINSSLINLFLILWSLGSCLQLVKLFWEYHRCYSLFHTSATLIKKDNKHYIYAVLAETKKAMHIKTDVHIAISQNFSQPCIFGIFHPVIGLPEKAYTPQQLQCIITHELSHYKHNDTLWRLLFGFVKALYWWVPTLYVLERQLGLYLEIHCDYKSVHRCSAKVDKYDYFTTLIDLARSKANNPHKVPLFIFSGSSSSLQIRYKFFSKQSEYSFFRTVLRKGIYVLLLVSTIILFSLAFVPPVH